MICAVAVGVNAIHTFLLERMNGIARDKKAKNADFKHINKVIYEGGNLQRFHNCLLSEASYYCFSSHNGCYARILDLHQQHIPSYVICDEVGITDFYIFGNQVSRHPKIRILVSNFWTSKSLVLS